MVDGSCPSVTSSSISGTGSRIISATTLTWTAASTRLTQFYAWRKGIFQNRDMPLEIRVKFYKAVVVNTLLWGCETWSMGMMAAMTPGLSRRRGRWSSCAISARKRTILHIRQGHPKRLPRKGKCPARGMTLRSSSLKVDVVVAGESYCLRLERLRTCGSCSILLETNWRNMRASIMSFQGPWSFRQAFIT